MGDGEAGRGGRRIGDGEAGRGGRRIGDGEADRDISLLFDVFVVHQRVRALLARALAGSELRADEYAVYSVLFERGALTPTELAAGLAMPVTTVLDYLRVMTRRGHIGRARNPADGRSYTVSLTVEGLRAHRRTNALWEVGVRGLEDALRMPVAEVRAALQALDDAAGAALAQFGDAGGELPAGT
jgi:DNA-binding MarR family transcriptional regulator